MYGTRFVRLSQNQILPKILSSYQKGVRYKSFNIKLRSNKNKQTKRRWKKKETKNILNLTKSKKFHFQAEVLIEPFLLSLVVTWEFKFGQTNIIYHFLYTHVDIESYLKMSEMIHFRDWKMESHLSLCPIAWHDWYDFDMMFLSYGFCNSTESCFVLLLLLYLLCLGVLLLVINDGQLKLLSDF